MGSDDEQTIRLARPNPVSHSATQPHLAPGIAWDADYNSQAPSSQQTSLIPPVPILHHTGSSGPLSGYFPSLYSPCKHSTNSRSPTASPREQEPSPPYARQPRPPGAPAFSALQEGDFADAPSSAETGDLDDSTLRMGQKRRNYEFTPSDSAPPAAHQPRIVSAVSSTLDDDATINLGKYSPVVPRAREAFTPQTEPQPKALPAYLTSTPSEADDTELPPSYAPDFLQQPAPVPEPQAPTGPPLVMIPVLQMNGEPWEPIPMAVQPDGSPILPLNEDGVPMVPLGPDGRPLILLGADHKPITPVGPDGQRLILLGPDGKPIIPVDADGNLCLPVPTPTPVPSSELDDISADRPTRAKTRHQKTRSWVSSPRESERHGSEPNFSTLRPSRIKEDDEEEDSDEEGTSTRIMRSDRRLVQSERISSEPIERSHNRAQLTSSLNMTSKRECMRVERHQKNMARLLTKQQRELKQLQDKLQLRLQALRDKQAIEEEKYRAQLERDEKQFEKLQAKAAKQNDTNLDENTREVGRQQDKLVQQSEAKYVEVRKEEKVKYQKKRAELMEEQKSDASTKKRSKFTYDKRYIKQLKYSQKVELAVTEKLHLFRLEHLKLMSDADLSYQQHCISCNLVEETNQQMCKHQMKQRTKHNHNVMKTFDALLDHTLESLGVFHAEQVTCLEQVQAFQKKQYLRRFEAEAQHQNTIIDSNRATRKKTLKNKGKLNATTMAELEGETAKFAEEALSDLSDVQKSQMRLLHQRFEKERTDLEIAQAAEIFGKKLEAARKRIAMVQSDHEGLRALLAEREQKGLRTLLDGNEAGLRFLDKSQADIADHLELQFAGVQELLEKESKKMLPDYQNDYFRNAKQYFEEHRSEMEEKNQLKLEEVKERHGAAENALKDLYAAMLESWEREWACELKSYQTDLTHAEAATPL